MRNPANEYDTLTLNLPNPKGDFLRAQLALTHQAKNLYNTALFLVRQVFTAYHYDSVHKISHLKTDLQPIQIQVIEAYNAQIVKINQKRTDKYPAQCAKSVLEKKEPPELKLVPALTSTVTSLSSIVLDATTLDNMARHWKSGKDNAQGESVYKRLPGVMAQQVMKKLGENFSSFFMASLRFKGSQKDMTGRPCMPGYLGKSDRFTLEIPLTHIHRNGNLPSLKGKVVPEDYQETSYLTPEMLVAFSQYDVTGTINTSCQKRGWSDFQPQHLRFVPVRHGIRMELVVRVRNAYPAQSFMAKLIHRHGEALAVLKNDKARQKWLLEHLQSTKASLLPNMAGMDLNVNNLVVVAYSTGHRAAVHDGGRFEATLAEMSELIGSRISSITPDRAKELQAKKLALQKESLRLEKAEHIELNTILKSVFEDAEYRRLVAKKSRWVSDYLHKISRALIQHCQFRKIDVIVIGKNKGWKIESDMGKKQNRRFCQIAHAKLVNLIQYKAQAAGMAVVTTEESYTSKTSFVNGDILENFDEKVIAKDLGEDIPFAPKTGKRSTSDRNRFVHKNRSDRWKVVHADVNGAFNIICKVFKSFKYHVDLTLKYTIYRLSPIKGVTGLVAFVKAKILDKQSRRLCA